MCLLAVAVLLHEPPSAGLGEISPPVEVTGEVQAEQCAPCHLRIAESKVPGIIFTHGNHLMVSCAACHYRRPHESGRTYRPPMEACFNCHGISHGPQGELATSRCRDCHAPSFKLRPASHVRDWKARPHATRGKLGVNQCMMCHRAARDCDACHRREDVDVDPMPRGYVTQLPATPRTPAVRVFPDRATSMGQCVYCHPDIDAFAPGRIIFAHAEHLRRNFPCTACHPRFGHEAERVLKPDMRSCYRCHGLTHAAQGLVATGSCDACHPKGFTLKPPDHTKRFVKGEHKVVASRDGAYCSMCHQPEFCSECHRGRKRKDGTRGKPVVPVDHRQVAWRGAHGTLFLAQRGACASCHESPSCTRCHRTVMPHPVDWLGSHAQAGRADPKDCDVCHTDRRRCQECHHDQVKRGQLIARNCVPCHGVMRKRPATAIKDKVFAEHAVHFDVAKKKGKPYVCDDCHIGFGTTQSQASLTQAHDLRLCYGCHGGLDYRNILIAPYGGAQLCLRCHTDLNI